MESTLTGESTRRGPHQRALHFSLLFGASGGVAPHHRRPAPYPGRERVLASGTQHGTPGAERLQLGDGARSDLKVGNRSWNDDAAT